MGPLLTLFYYLNVSGEYCMCRHTLWNTGFHEVSPFQFRISDNTMDKTKVVTGKKMNH